MNIILIGTGRMGRLLKECALALLLIGGKSLSRLGNLLCR